MSDHLPAASTPDDVAEAIAAACQARGVTVAAAESLTGGLVVSQLAKASAASEWLRGGLVAYSREVKYDVLGVPRGPVVSEPAARAMAEGVAKLCAADVAVALTGVGGPDEQDGEPPGTVWLAVYADGAVTAQRLCLGGDPSDVCGQARDAALAALLAAVR